MLFRYKVSEIEVNSLLSRCFDIRRCYPGMQFSIKLNETGFAGWTIPRGAVISCQFIILTEVRYGQISGNLQNHIARNLEGSISSYALQAIFSMFVE